MYRKISFLLVFLFSVSVLNVAQVTEAQNGARGYVEPSLKDNSGTYVPVEGGVIYSDDFNGDNTVVGVTGRGWVWINQDGGGTTATSQGATTVFNAYEGPADGYLSENYNGANGFLIDQWLISPSFTVAAGDTLSFWWRSAGGQWDDSVYVKISEGGATIPDFTLTVGRYRVPDLVWTRYTYIFATGGTKRVALQYYHTDGGPSGTHSNYWGLDLFQIISGAPPSGPGPATNPNPTNAATSVGAVGLNLGWTNPAGATTNQVFFGMDMGSMSSIHSGSLVSSVAAPTPLQYNTTYYWRVDETDGTGTTTGNVWSFTTKLDPSVTIDVLVLHHDPSVTGSQAKRLADRDTLLAALDAILPSSYIVNTFNASTVLTGLDQYKSIILQETSFDDLTTRYLSAASRDTLKAWLSGGTAGNKRSLIFMGADQGYNYSRAGSAAQDLVLCQTFLKFNYRMDNGNVTGQNSITGVTIDNGNVRTVTTSPVGGGFYPDGVEALGSSVLYQYTGRSMTDSLSAVGVNEPGYNALSLFVDPRYFTNGNFQEVLLAMIEEAVANGGSFTGLIPVELNSFAASVVDGKVNLKWQTASETNNYGFEVERKLSGQQFTKVAFVGGYGTTSETKNYTFVDNSVNSGSYTYRLKQIDFDGTFAYSNEVEVDLAPFTYSLAQNYPNPFNPSTKIDFVLAADSKVTMKIFDILGQEVTKLVNGNLGAGVHSVEFNASLLNSGVYFYTIEATGIDGKNFTSTKKMMLTK